MATTYEFDARISSAVRKARERSTKNGTVPSPRQQGVVAAPLAPAQLEQMDRYWQAANYLTVGQIYLLDNPLLREPLNPQHIKPRLLGHWGTSPGLSLIYIHLNRLINEHDANVIYLAGPGHGGPALVANVYLEGTYSEIYPEVTQDTGGTAALCPPVLDSRRHSQPRQRADARLDPRGRRARLRAGARVRRGLRQPGSRSSPRSSATARRRPGRWRASWKGTSFLNPARDGAVLPILHLNGYKISGPTVLGRESDDDVREPACRATATRSISSRATTRTRAPGASPRRSTGATSAIRAIQQRGSRARVSSERPRWPAIVLRTPKGWTGPKVVDGHPVEGTFRAHQVPLANVRSEPRAARRCSRSGCAATSRRSCSTPSGKLDRRSGRAGAAGRPPHGRQPACERRQAPRSIWTCPTSATTPSRSRARRRAARIHAPARQDAARHLHAQRRARRTSACSVPTRRTRTGSATSSRSRIAASSAGRSTSTITCRPMAASWRC